MDQFQKSPKLELCFYWSQSSLHPKNRTAAQPLRSPLPDSIMPPSFPKASLCYPLCFPSIADHPFPFPPQTSTVPLSHSPLLHDLVNALLFVIFTITAAIHVLGHMHQFLQEKCQWVKLVDHRLCTLFTFLDITKDLTKVVYQLHYHPQHMVKSWSFISLPTHGVIRLYFLRSFSLQVCPVNYSLLTCWWVVNNTFALVQALPNIGS